MGKPRTGSVFYHHDTRHRRGGYWAGVISLGGGKRRTVTGQSEAEVRAKMADLGLNPPPTRAHPREWRSSAEATATIILRRAVSLGWSLEFTAKALVAGMTRQRVRLGVNGPCAYCGDELANTVDHVIPQTAGGTDAPDNLVSACAPCNYRKGDRSANRLLAAAPIAVWGDTPASDEAA